MTPAVRRCHRIGIALAIAAVLFVLLAGCTTGFVGSSVCDRPGAVTDRGWCPK